MFTKTYRRLFKEAILRMSAFESRWASRKFWCDSPESLDELATGIRALHSVDDLPWPSDQAIIVTPGDFFSRFLGYVLDDQIEVFIYDRLVDNEARECDGFVDEEHGVTASSTHVFANFAVWKDRNEIGWGPIANFQLIRADFGTRENLLKWLSAHPFMTRLGLDAACGSMGLSVDRDAVYERIMEFERSTWPSDGSQAWIGRHSFKGRPSEITTALPALAGLVGLAFPCGYQVMARCPLGFGPSQSRAKTSGLSVMCHVNYDRLYRITEEAHANEGRDVDPHFRRGHYRHMWKEAGLDRLALPESAYERMRLVLEKKVRRIYVHPAWVGKARFSYDGWDWEIVTGETEM